MGAGSRIAGYLLEEQVGRGGMAVVFRARDDRLDRLVALKILEPSLAADEAFRQRFIRESRAAAMVDHPHIIPVHEAGEADGVLFIAMRHVPGGSVRDMMQQARPLAPGRVVAIVSPVASALDAAHAAGLVHRDVTPANILVDVQPGRPDHVYLSDFGLSKGALSSVGLTQTGQLLGTPNYMSPEQIEGRSVDGRSDQYALACVAFELLANEAPFQRDNGLAVLNAHLQQPPPRLASRHPGLPAAVDDVLAKALAKAPSDRYANCQAFADALRQALGLAPYDSGPGVVRQINHSPTQLAWPPNAGGATETRHAAYRARVGEPVVPAGNSTVKNMVGSDTATYAPRRRRAGYAIVAAAVIVAVALTLVFTEVHSHNGNPSANGAPARHVTTKPAPAKPVPTSPIANRPPSSTAVRSGTWSGGQQIASTNAFASISCPTARFCLAADNAGNVYTYSGGSWSAADPIDSGGALTSVSCATASFCVATSSGASVYTDSGGTWSTSQLVGADGNSANLTSVSCPAAGYCLATGDWDSYTYSHGSWSGGDLVQDSNDFTSISCPTTRFCLAADNAGNAYSYSAN